MFRSVWQCCVALLGFQRISMKFMLILSETARPLSWCATGYQIWQGLSSKETTARFLARNVQKLRGSETPLNASAKGTTGSGYFKIVWQKKLLVCQHVALTCNSQLCRYLAGAKDHNILPRLKASIKESSCMLGLKPCWQFRVLRRVPGGLS